MQADGKLGPQLDELSALLSDSAALMASKATTTICGCSCGSLAISLQLEFELVLWLLLMLGMMLMQGLMLLLRHEYGCN